MTQKFRVVDCRTPDGVSDDIEVLASTPEEAARLAIGEELVRGSHGSRHVRVKVYSGSSDTLNMVRLYSKSETAGAIKSRLQRSVSSD